MCNPSSVKRHRQRLWVPSGLRVRNRMVLPSWLRREVRVRPDVEDLPRFASPVLADGTPHHTPFVDLVDPELGRSASLAWALRALSPTSATRSAFHLISSDFDRRASCKGLVSLMGALGNRL